jgi:hypothetical protein
MASERRTATPHFATLTPEELQAVRTKARAARAANAAARKASPLRTDFLDHPTWDEMARERNLRLPPWGTPPTPLAITKWIHKLGKTQAWYKDVTGYQSMEQFRQRNPDWPARALAGTLLESLAYEERSGA